MTLAPQPEMKILGVIYDSKMTFRTYITHLASTVAGKVAVFGRIFWLFDCEDRELLYKAQVRSSLEYSCLAWGGAASSHLAMLEKFQQRAVRIICDDHPEQQSNLHSRLVEQN